MSRRRCAWPVCLVLVAACDARLTSLGAYDPPTGQYLEAEDGELEGGFTTRADREASEDRCIAPPDAMRSDDEPGEARARYRFEIEHAGNYTIWGRVRGPDAVHNRFWFRVDAGAWFLWRISTGDIWYWDDFHDDTEYGRALEFELSKGEHELSIANAVEGIELDRLYLTADGDHPPGDDTECSPPHSIEVEGECRPSCGSIGGNRCGAADCDGRPLMAAYDCAICCRVEP